MTNCTTTLVCHLAQVRASMTNTHAQISAADSAEGSVQCGAQTGAGDCVGFELLEQTLRPKQNAQNRASIRNCH